MLKQGCATKLYNINVIKGTVKNEKNKKQKTTPPKKPQKTNPPQRKER